MEGKKKKKKSVWMKRTNVYGRKKRKEKTYG